MGGNRRRGRRGRGGANGSERGHGGGFDVPEESFGVSSGTQIIEKGTGGCVKVLSIGTDTVKADELGLDYCFECVFWMVTRFM